MVCRVGGAACTYMFKVYCVLFIRYGGVITMLKVYCLFPRYGGVSSQRGVQSGGRGMQSSNMQQGSMGQREQCVY